MLLNEIWLAVTDRSVNLPILTTVPALISRSTTSKIKLRRGFSMLGTMRTCTDVLFVEDDDDATGDMDVLVASVRDEVGCCVDVLEKRRPRRADAPCDRLRERRKVDEVGDVVVVSVGGL